MVPSFLHLREIGVPRDVRRLLYAKLDKIDKYMVEIAHGTRPMPTTQNDLLLSQQACVAAGNLPILQYIYRKSKWPYSSICELAAACGHVHILEWAAANGATANQVVSEMAAGNGHLAVMHWATRNNSISRVAPVAIPKAKIKAKEGLQCNQLHFGKRRC
jgi:hypothetical protein